MKIIDRYILRSHIGPFLFGFMTVVFIFLMQFVMITIDHLLGKGLESELILQLVVYNLPWMVVLAAPMGILFSTLMAFGNMSSASEITIIKTSGRGLYRMMVPSVIGGFMLSGILFWFNDYVLPEANHKSKTLLYDIKKTKPSLVFESGRFVSELDGYTIFARNVDSATGDIYGMTIYDNTKMPTVNIISADTGTIRFSSDFTKLILDMNSGEVHQFKNQMPNNYKIIEFERYNINMPADGFGFSSTDEGVMSRGQREMTIVDMEEVSDAAYQKTLSIDSMRNHILLKHLDLILLGKRDSSEKYFISQNLPITYQSESSYMSSRNSNVKVKTAEKKTTQKLDSNDNIKASMIATMRDLALMRNRIVSEFSRQDDYMLQKYQYDVEIHKKYAIPFACLVFVFVGCPLGIRSKKGNFGVSAIISLGFYLLYWACLISGEKLADRGKLDPMLAMWMGNIIVAFIGLILMLKTNNENFKLLKFFRLKN